MAISKAVKESIPESMKGIIDEDLLKARKSSLSHQPKKRKVKLEKKEAKWFEKEITASDFIKKEDKNGMLYAHHKEWKNRIWIGPYKTKRQLDEIISEYVSNSKKKPLDRVPIENIHSIIIEDETQLV